MQFTCSLCNEIHEGFPAIGFNSPYAYDILSDIEKVEIAELSSDFCVIKYPEQTDRFIRVVLKQKIIGSSETLEYGIWASLSEKSFNNYKKNYDSENHISGYFGFLSNAIPGYLNTLSVEADVKTQSGKSRPEIFPHEDQMENDFVRDYFNGITQEEAERRMHLALGS